MGPRGKIGQGTLKPKPNMELPTIKFYQGNFKKKKKREI
jgi:hypothetical protein